VPAKAPSDPPSTSSGSGPSGVGTALAEAPTLIIGAGLSGLAAAVALAERGEPFVLIDAADAPGGRVRSDVVDGFILDRGFQVLLTSYEEAARVLDFEALDLGTFEPGAFVRVGETFARAADPWRRPTTAFSPSWLRVLRPADAWRLMRLRALALDGDAPIPAISTAAFLAERGFSEHAIGHFFRPFFGGVFLDRTLSAPAPVFMRLFARFAKGLAAVPARGMQAIADQLAARLPAGSLQLKCSVRAITRGTATFDDGSTATPKRIVLATGGRVARQVLLAGEDAQAASLEDLAGVGDEATTTQHYALAGAPPKALTRPMLYLGGPDDDVVHHVAPMSAVAPGLAPAGATLLSASTDGVADASPAHEARVRQTLGRWFGIDPERLRHLRTDAIRHALPAQTAARLEAPGHRKLGPGLVVCGDDLGDRSIEGALLAGRAAAAALFA
jgi:phytoene dehydrogenase-like protein